MFLRKGIRLKTVLHDSRRLLVLSFAWAVLVDVLHDMLGYTAFALPTMPVTTAGIVVSLYLGFKSTSA